MAEKTILSEDAKFLLEFSESLRSFVYQYGTTEIKIVDKNLEVKRTIPKEWIDLLKDITMCKFQKKGDIIIQEERFYKILYDFLIQDDNVIDIHRFYELVHLLENKLSILCEKKYIDIDKEDTFSISFEIISCYFHPIISFGDEKLFYTNGDYTNIIEIISDIFGESRKNIFYILYLFVRDLDSIPPKDRINMIIHMINDPEDIKSKTVFTYIGTDLSGCYKIGRSCNVDKREKSLKVGNHSYSTIIIIKGDFEKELHNKFSVKQVSGEWFHLSEKDLEYIASNYEILFNKKL